MSVIFLYMCVYLMVLNTHFSRKDAVLSVFQPLFQDLRTAAILIVFEVVSTTDLEISLFMKILSF